MKIFEIVQAKPLSNIIPVPVRDSRGFQYRRLRTKKPVDSKSGDSGWYVGIKATCPYHSATERIALHFLDFNTRVRIFRTHLPIYDSKKFVRKYEANETIWANEVATVDIDVLYETDDEVNLAQHGVSCKENWEEFEKRGEARRAARENAFYESIGATWEPVVKSYFEQDEYDNYEFVLKHIRRSNVFGLDEQARRVAELWKRRGADDAVQDLLEPFARTIGTDRHNLMKLTCVAIYLGHLRLDHQYQFNQHTQIQLRPDGIYRFGREVEPLPWGFS
ncbi:hypothetical protein [Paraburkholderia sp. 40]|uniref:hypothetical protein n=1 Tax=Paraburkholderia sp. 40 TaxID=2991059 RepID=UPI003D1B6854